jgi:2-polyprenyl-3-methyl-5-hydroxy-6-metoxy-1,4-benzoquinol methylase
MFEKYKKYGAYHWKSLDSSSFRNILNRSLPLYTRYQICLKYVSSDDNFALDIGCGDGALSYLMVKKGVEEVIGFDSDTVAIQLAEKKTHDLPHSESVSFKNCLVQDGGIEAKSVDVIVLADVIEHVEEVDALLKEIKRIGKPGGKLLVTTPYAKAEGLWDDNHVVEYTEENLRSVLQKHFLNVSVGVFLPLFLYKIYCRFRLFRYSSNILTLFGINPLMLKTPFKKYVMLEAVCYF